MMPAYNAEKFIRQAIESLLNQSYHLWELILVNDGSTDQTGKIIEEFTDPEDIKDVMNLIVHYDKMIRDLRAEAKANKMIF